MDVGPNLSVATLDDPSGNRDVIDPTGRDKAGIAGMVSERRAAGTTAIPGAAVDARTGNIHSFVESDRTPLPACPHRLPDRMRSPTVPAYARIRAMPDNPANSRHAFHRL